MTPKVNSVRGLSITNFSLVAIMMGSKPFRGYKGEISYLFVICILISLVLGTSNGNVVVIGSNISLSFDDVEAKFAPSVKGSGVCGILYVAEPLDACSPLTNKVISEEGVNSPIALIIRGGCTFTDKVRRAQTAGFKAVIVYDNEDGSPVAMAGNSAGIKIYAVFVSKAAGEKLKTYAGMTDTELWIIPTFENSAWSIMAISFILLLALSAVLATCFFIRRHRIRRERIRASPNVPEFHGMSSRLVRALPSLVFTSVLEDNCTSRTCAICLEDYAVGEKLRILPCRHKFHAVCVDSWLTTWRTFCPMCKRDARTSTGNPPASECTPLLSSTPATASPSQSPVHSSLSSTTSSAIQIAPPRSSRSPGPSRITSLSSTSYVPHSLRSSYRNSPVMSISRSSVDLRNASSHRSHTTYLATSHSVGYRFSPLDSIYASPYIPSSSNASPLLGGSSSRQQYLLHCDSAVSISSLASAQSLPGC